MRILLFSLGFLILIVTVLFLLIGRLKNFKNSREKSLILGSFLYALLFSFSAYYFWGGSQKLFNYYHEEAVTPIIAKWRNQFSNVDAVITRMENHLSRNPNSAQGWYLLGRLYFSQQNYEKAEKAFAKAQALRPEDNLILIERATVLLYATDHPEYLPKIFQLLQEVITRDPKNSAANNLLGMWAFREKKYELAIKYWQIVLADFLPNSPEYKSLVAAINQAEQLMASDRNDNGGVPELLPEVLF